MSRPVAPDAPVAELAEEHSPTPEEIFARYRVAVPESALRPPDVSEIAHRTDSAFRWIGDGAVELRAAGELYRAVVHPDPNIGDTSVLRAQEQGYAPIRRGADGVPVRLAGLSTPNEVIMWRSHEVAAAKRAEAVAANDRQSLGRKTSTTELPEGASLRTTTTSRRIPAGLSA